MQRAERVRAAESVDYFVIIKRFRRHRRAHQTGWTWAIRRRSRPLAVKIGGDDYVTPQDAKLAGETALSELLHKLS
jgi:hypothetical protein